jgi:ubiquinone/menaquinone biosynthesis C-methylase UbiE
MEHIHARVRQQFSRHAVYYAQSKVHAEGETLGVIVELAEPKGTEKTLDIATGTGFTAFAMASKVAHVTATDLTPAMLEQAKKLARERGIKNVDFQVAAAEALPFAAEAFDLVTCRIAPHHFQDARRFLAESYRVLRKGRLFCMVDSVCPESERLIQWQNRVEKMRDASHVWAYPPSAWREMIRQSGFHIEKEAYTRNAEIQFSWWAAREGNSPELVKQIRVAFDELTPEEERCFAIRRDEGELYFAWPMYSVKARKRE